MKEFLASSLYIDYENEEIAYLARSLALDTSSKSEIAKNCFEWVRDNIKHSADYKLNPVTCKASDVLKFKTGYCYAKSHLLAALLRVNEIPAGLCYQRLTIQNDAPPFCLHGLNAVYLEDIGWYRIDARGNKEGVNAQFTPPLEQLAFDIKLAQECNIPDIFSEPLSVVTDTLEKYDSYLDVYVNLPDIRET